MSTKGVDVDTLQPGDILLVMSEGPLSDLIAWASDGAYSHAALVVDGGDVIEASLGGVRRSSLARRVADTGRVHYIDAWRPMGEAGQPFGAADLSLVVRHAGTMLGAPYPVDQLALFGAIMALRGKWPADPLLRKVVRIALDHAVPSDSPALLCSEVVYRAWAECAAEPQGQLAPRIVEGERGTAPLPDIDWVRLAAEVGPLLGPQTAGNALQGGLSTDAAALLGAGGTPTDADLDAARQRVLADAGATAALRSAGPALVAHRPNPRLVSPQDLANSPDTRLLGRVMRRGGG